MITSYRISTTPHEVTASKIMCNNYFAIQPLSLLIKCSQNLSEIRSFRSFICSNENQRFYTLQPVKPEKVLKIGLVVSNISRLYSQLERVVG